MPNRLDGKVTIGSGGARGLGAAHGELLAEAGASIVFGDNLDDGGRAWESHLRTKGHPATYLRLGVTKPEDLDRAVETARNQFGALTTLVNNAGIFTTGWADGHFGPDMAIGDLGEPRRSMALHASENAGCARGRSGARSIHRECLLHLRQRRLAQFRRLSRLEGWGKDADQCGRCGVRSSPHPRQFGSPRNDRDELRWSKFISGEDRPRNSRESLWDAAHRRAKMLTPHCFWLLARPPTSPARSSWSTAVERFSDGW